LVIKAAIAHLWFVTIHPFEDGNRRITRPLTDMLFAHSDESNLRFYSISAQIRKEREIVEAFGTNSKRRFLQLGVFTALLRNGSCKKNLLVVEV
jgi:Fic family protein